MAFSAITGRGQTTLATASSDIAITPTGTIAVGQIAIAQFFSQSISATDGATTDHQSVADTQGNTWTKVAEYSQSDASATDGSTISVFYTLVTSQLTTGSTITLTMSGSSSERLAELIEVTGTNVAVEQENVGQNTLTAAVSGLTSREYLLLYTAASRGSDQLKTPGANYTEQFDARSRNNAAAIAGYSATRIATLTSDSTAATAWSTTANTIISSLTAFR